MDAIAGVGLQIGREIDRVKQWVCISTAMLVILVLGVTTRWITSTKAAVGREFGVRERISESRDDVRSGDAYDTVRLRWYKLITLRKKKEDSRRRESERRWDNLDREGEERRQKGRDGKRRRRGRRLAWRCRAHQGSRDNFGRAKSPCGCGRPLIERRKPRSQ